MTDRTILIVDDDAEIRASLNDALSREGVRIAVAPDAETALQILTRQPPDLVLSDVRMPGMDGLTLLRRIRETSPGTAVVLMTAFDDLSTVTTGMREGAVEFLVKPIELGLLRSVVSRVFEDRMLSSPAAAGPVDEGGTQTRTKDRSPLDELTLIGHAPAMVSIFKTIGQVAATRTSVMIRGESGTGKELIARAIHAASPWAGEPFVAVNCTALPASLLESELFGHVKGSFTGAAADRKGRIALAGSGTLFLDEVGDTSPDFQAKMLRVLQERTYFPVGADRPRTTDARILTATHRNLEDMVADGAFRQDLYYRLRVVELVIPPLRERTEDIAELASHLVEKASRSVGRPAPQLSGEALAALKSHAWPGNVRELENCLMRAVVVAPAGVIRPEHLALEPRPAPADTRLVPLDRVEAEHVGAVLSAVGGNRSHAAEVLGISRPRLRRLIEKHALEANTEAEPDD